jgi:hypothetical protein
MDPATDYYIGHGGGGHRDDFFGSPYVQMGHGIVSLLASHFRAVKAFPNHKVRRIAYGDLVKQVITHDNTRAQILAGSCR